MLETEPSRLAEAVGRVRSLFPNLHKRELMEMFVIGLRKPEHLQRMEEAVIRLGFPE